MKRCNQCKTTKPDEAFWTRMDNGNLFAWCIECCEKQVRSRDYPPEKERGGGVLYPDYRTVKSGSLSELARRGL